MKICVWTERAFVKTIALMMRNAEMRSPLASLKKPKSHTVTTTPTQPLPLYPLPLHPATPLNSIRRRTSTSDRCPQNSASAIYMIDLSLPPLPHSHPPRCHPPRCVFFHSQRQFSWHLPPSIQPPALSLPNWSLITPSRSHWCPYGRYNVC